MPKPSRKTKVNVTVAIRPRLVPPAQQQAWKRFWQKLITEARNEAAK